MKGKICVDGKTMRFNKRKDGKPNHIITAWNREDGFSFGQKVVNTKSIEITAIPKLLEKIRIKEEIRWMIQKKEWKGLKSIGME